MFVVTGGAGFIGSNLVAALNDRGHRDILVCDRLRSDGKWRNLAKRDFADIVPPDRLVDHLAASPDEIRAVFHLGAISSTTATDGDLVYDTNCRFSLALWDWCLRSRVPLIYASSAATYGDGGLGFDDDPDPAAQRALRPLNLYGWSKQQFDLRATDLAARGEAPPQWAGLKFFNVFGPNEYHKGAMQSVAAKVFPDIAAGRPARLFKSHRPGFADGGQLRDFVWVEDAVAVLLWLYDNPAVSGIFNVGTGQARSFADLVRSVFLALGREPAIEYFDMPAELRDKYQYFTEARMDRLRAAGFVQPFTPLEDAVRRYVRDFLASRDPYR
mgnify:CR=1 FL=1